MHWSFEIDYCDKETDEFCVFRIFRQYFHHISLEKVCFCIISTTCRSCMCWWIYFGHEVMMIILCQMFIIFFFKIQAICASNMHRFTTQTTQRYANLILRWLLYFLCIFFSINFRKFLNLHLFWIQINCIIAQAIRMDHRLKINQLLMVLTCWNYAIVFYHRAQWTFTFFWHTRRSCFC